jgi:2-haloacid dehalogenase/putative hydrolase of the HAD superfamily
MGRAYDIVTFDCYGTLVDWERGIVEAFAGAGARARRESLVAAYHEVEPIVEGGPYRAYRDVLRETALRVAQRLDWPLESGAAEFLPRSLPDWPLFPDVRPALERLSGAGYRLGLLSNVDADLLAATIERLGIGFDLRVTAQDVRSYKPSPAHFREARRRIGNASWLHAAQSLFHDVSPARTLGIPVAWINRKGERVEPGRRPALEFPSLAGLAEWLAPGGSASRP